MTEPITRASQISHPIHPARAAVFAGLERAEVGCFALIGKSDVHAVVDGGVAGLETHEGNIGQIAVRLAGLDELGLVEAFEILIFVVKLEVEGIGGGLAFHQVNVRDFGAAFVTEVVFQMVPIARDIDGARGVAA